MQGLESAESGTAVSKFLPSVADTQVSPLAPPPPTGPPTLNSLAGEGGGGGGGVGVRDGGVARDNKTLRNLRPGIRVFPGEGSSGLPAHSDVELHGSQFPRNDGLEREAVATAARKSVLNRHGNLLALSRNRSWRLIKRD